MIETGQKIYFRKEADGRLLKGTVLDVTDNGIQVRGCRTATKITPPVFTLTASQIVTDHVPERLRSKQRESGHGNSLSIIAAESIRRQQISAERLGMSEIQVLQARAMLEIRRRAVRSLAGMNRIAANRQDYDYQELHSEYIVAQLTSLRATAASATDADIREFKQYLNGEANDSRMMMTISRTSRTAAVRYLKKRQEYHLAHCDICNYENQLSA
ncbi:MAG: hypothetical protein WCK54_18360 [Desulfuromonadales bacterium]